MPGPTPHVDGAEVLSQCHPGDRLAVWFLDDTMFHERVLVWPHDRENWWVYTPDGDLYIEQIVGDGEEGASAFRVKGADFQFWSRLRQPVYRFRDQVDDDALKGLIKNVLDDLEAEGGTSAVVPSHVRSVSGDLVAVTKFLGHTLVRRRARVKGPPGARALAAPTGVIEPAGDHGDNPARRSSFPAQSTSQVWVVADPRGNLPVGRELVPDLGDVFLGGGDGVFFREGLWVRGELVDQSGLDSWRVDRVKSLSGIPPVNLGAERLGISADDDKVTEDKEGVPKDSAEGVNDEDARTLWVEYDDQNERFRDWRKVCADSASHNWPDWPHQGPPSLLYTMKHFHRHGGDPRTWMQSWLRKHHLAETDRTAHEVRSLVEALWLGGCYDQLNMPSLASFEAIGRRLQTIVEAYSSAFNGVPDWSHAKLFTGIVSSDDIVSSELRSWAARRGKEEVELVAARSKMKDMRKLLAGSDSTSSNLEDALPNPKGKAEGGRLRKPEEDTNEAIQSLNWLAGAPLDRGVFSPSRLQQEALGHVKAACVASLELPEGVTSPVTPEAAFRELLRGSSVYEAAGSSLASFKLERISLPDSVHGCPEVENLLSGTDALQYLEDPERMLRPESEYACDITPYWDPLLRCNMRHYKALIQKLHEVGLLSFTLTPKERAGIFFVHKSDGIRQRLIIDGRRANARLATPPSVRLCSPESFAKAEFIRDNIEDENFGFPGFQAVPELHIGLSDIRDCFHRLKQPRWLQEYFCLDPVPAAWVGMAGEKINNKVLDGSDLIYPMPSSLPMGCSWSLYFAQTISEKLMGEEPFELEADPDYPKVTLVETAIGEITSTFDGRGYGVCSREVGPEVAANIGRIPERERFRRGSCGGARAAALASILDEEGEDDGADVDALLQAGWEVNTKFVEVPRAILRKSDWQVNFHGKWMFPDDILVLEGYALVKALSRIAHTRHGANIRQLLLVDNLPVALSFERGHSRNFKLLRSIRKFSALCLCRNISCAIRWIPSELNSADEPSRIFESDGSQGQGVDCAQVREESASKKFKNSSSYQFGGNREKLLRPLNLPLSERDLQGITAPERSASPGDSSSSSAEEVLPQNNRDRVLATRSRKRLRKYLDTALASHDKGTTFLEDQAVTKGVLKTYDREVELFNKFLRLNNLSRDTNLDGSIARYLNSLFWQGEKPYRGEKFLAGWMHRHPQFGRVGDQKLARSWRALKGWRRLCPSGSRKPMPLGLWCALAVELARVGQVRMALFVMVSVSTYCRPSELLALPTSSLIPPSQGILDEWALLVAPQEFRHPTKTGEYDHSVALDSKFLKPWAATFWSALKLQRPTDKLWDFNYSQYLSSFKAACASLKVQLTPYQTRHSGPSIDRAQNNRLLFEVQKRGNWKCHKSVQRYEKAARLGLSYQIKACRQACASTATFARLDSGTCSLVAPPRQSRPEKKASIIDFCGYGRTLSVCVTAAVAELLFVVSQASAIFTSQVQALGTCLGLS
ncbi:unnamed protein product [Symbiodinium sp. KB8]|nr:unnamed protein product [Symbiodinium sp. KB8]